jgi:hypothetical protein
MKIVDIRTIPLSYRCEPPYGSAGGMQAARCIPSPRSQTGWCSNSTGIPTGCATNC